MKMKFSLLRLRLLLLATATFAAETEQPSHANNYFISPFFNTMRRFGINIFDDSRTPVNQETPQPQPQPQHDPITNALGFGLDDDPTFNVDLDDYDYDYDMLPRDPDDDDDPTFNVDLDDYDYEMLPRDIDIDPDDDDDPTFLDDDDVDLDPAIPPRLRPYYDKYDPSYVGEEDDTRYHGQGEEDAIFLTDPIQYRNFRGRPSPVDIDVHDDRRIEVLGPFDDCFLEFHQWTVKYQKVYNSDAAYNTAHQNFKHTKSVVKDNNGAYESGEINFKLVVNQFADLDDDDRNQAMFGAQHTAVARPRTKDLPHGLWTLFHRWTVKHSKIYDAAQKLMDRFEIWKHNHAFITEHNNGDHTYSLGHNHMSDTTQEERLQHLMKFPMPKKSEDTPVATWLEHVDPDIVPDSIDWRDMGAVTPVKDQGRCGSCWAFSAISTLESQVAIKTGVQQTLSVEELVACENKVSNGCDGGMYDPAWEFVKEHGIVTEDAWPYTSADGVTGECFPEKMKDPYLRTISGITDVPPFREELMVNALAKVGPISIAIDAGSQSFSFYADGIYDESPRLITLNHAVQIVGYTEDAWILRNSWATGWGKDGYMLLARNTGKRKGVLGEVVTPAFVVL